MGSKRVVDMARQHPLNDNYHRSEHAPRSYDHALPVGPFRMWLMHLMHDQNMQLTELAELVQLNERSLRRILGTPSKTRTGNLTVQKEVSLDVVDWALTKADGHTQLWHLYPELYETIDSDIEISA